MEPSRAMPARRSWLNAWRPSNPSKQKEHQPQTLTPPSPEPRGHERLWIWLSASQRRQSLTGP